MTESNFDRQVNSELANTLHSILDEAQFNDDIGAMRILLNTKLAAAKDTAKMQQTKIEKSLKDLQSYDRILIDQVINERLIDAGCKKLFTSQIGQYILEKGLVKASINDHGDVVYSQEYLDLELKSMRLEPKWEIFFNGDQDTSDTPDNPFMKATRNITKQGELVKNNPELAKRLKAEAEKAEAPTKKAPVNPWKAGTVNVTEQCRIAKENPELAKQLAAEAGKKLHLA
jgi:hypothetical protein